MRILASLYHPTGTWPFSGSERRFCAVSEEWKSMGVETFALEPPPFAKSNMSAGYIPLETPLAGPGLVGEFGSWVLRALSRGLDASHRFRFELVYATNNNIFNLAAGAILARRLSVPLVAVVHHLRWVYYGETPEVSREGRIAITKFVQNLWLEGVPVPDSLARVAGAYAELRLLSGCDGFITASRAVADQLSGLVNSDRIFVVENGIRTGPSTTYSPSREKNALFVGRLDEGKGVIDLLSLWRRIAALSPEAILHIVGEGSLRKTLSGETERRGLTGRVQYHGFTSDEKIGLLQAKARLFISLSRTEGFGLAMAESLAAGLPVLVWDIPPLREVFGSCQAVSLVPVDDFDQAASRAVNFLNLPDEQWQDISRKAIEYSRRFSWREAGITELRALQTIQGAKESNL